tara:strand:- start:6002 stop:7303 length:1302 start_codon:yes stop_codon:yes gene_type:complete
MKNLLLLELNELNFDAVPLYTKAGNLLPGFQKLTEKTNISTKAEDDYINLEPWIQWPSVHTGKTYSEHKIFRLGDIVNSPLEQFFEKVERANFTVGAISPMNASNNLMSPAYFIPDPWTQTSCDSSYFSNAVKDALVQAVNDNSQSKLTFRTLLNLTISFFVLVNPTRWIPLAKYAITVFSKPWRKALFLDMLLYEIHKKLFKKKKPNFSTLFLNAGAHIQHHYFYNSLLSDSAHLKNPEWYINKNVDPFLEMLRVYDYMLHDILNIENTEVIIATGLSQKLYEKIKFYYRLKNHKSFLNLVDIDFSNVNPRMTRDFLISFDTPEKAKKAEQRLSEIMVDNKEKLFGQIDNRGKDIFVVLTYPSEITKETTILINGKKFQLDKLVTFVAIKNGEHQNKGFAYFTDEIAKYAPKQESHVSELHTTVLKFFKINT